MFKFFSRKFLLRLIHDYLWDFFTYFFGFSWKSTFWDFWSGDLVTNFLRESFRVFASDYFWNSFRETIENISWDFIRIVGISSWISARNYFKSSYTEISRNSPINFFKTPMQIPSDSPKGCPKSSSRISFIIWICLQFYFSEIPQNKNFRILEWRGFWRILTNNLNNP